MNKDNERVKIYNDCPYCRESVDETEETVVDDIEELHGATLTGDGRIKLDYEAKIAHLKCWAEFREK